MKHCLNNESVSPQTLARIAEYFGVTVGDLLEDPGYPYNRKDMDFL